jgi:heme/copper-type cytochrome/quinol oxidase subunit 1
MALLNVGLVIFGATYHFLPELTGKPLWSETAARWHIWLTFFAGTFNSALWIWQGLEGAPRRFSVLPDAYVDLAVASVPTVIVLALAQILFFANVAMTVFGPGGKRAEPEAAPA